MLNVEQLLELEERLRNTLSEKLEQILSNLNRSGKLEEALELLGLSDLLQPDYCDILSSTNVPIQNLHTE